jgi:hypothetical protein
MQMARTLKSRRVHFQSSNKGKVVQSDRSDKSACGQRVTPLMGKSSSISDGVSIA